MSKREVRWLRSLIKVGRAQSNENGGFSVQHGERALLLSAEEVRALEAAGIVRRAGDEIFPMSEARTHLRRSASLDDPGDDFRQQHQQQSRDGEGITRNLKESPLARLAGQGNTPGYLAPHQVIAGERFARLFERALLRRRITMSYDPDRVVASNSGDAGQSEISDMAVDARRALARIHEVLPRECAELIVDVCGYEKGLQQIESERGWPRRSAKLVLRIALEQLAHHFGIEAEARGRADSRLRKWRPEGARPMALG